VTEGKKWDEGGDPKSERDLITNDSNLGNDQGQKPSRKGTGGKTKKNECPSGQVITVETSSWIGSVLSTGDIKKKG